MYLFFLLLFPHFSSFTSSFFYSFFFLFLILCHLLLFFSLSLYLCLYFYLCFPLLSSLSLILSLSCTIKPRASHTLSQLLFLPQHSHTVLGSWFPLTLLLHEKLPHIVCERKRHVGKNQVRPKEALIHDRADQDQ